MKRVRKTQYPSLRQIRNMATNLKEKYQAYASIQTMTHSFESGNFEANYWISVKGSFGFVDTWQELQDKYRELMKG